MSDYGDYFMDDEPQFGDEFAVFERVGGKQLGLTDIDGKQIRIGQDPLDKFQIIVDALSRKLINEFNNVYLDEDDITRLIDTARKFRDTVKYKNPYAYILGYIVSDGGKKINKARFDTIKNNILPKFVNDDSVRPEDVLRYGRFWTIIL